MMRGDKKWPPEHTRQQMTVEEEEQKKIAQGPAFRPRKAKKDYSSFFEQHKLNAAFPGYKPAPGTQFFNRTQNSNAQCNGSNNSNPE